MMELKLIKFNGLSLVTHVWPARTFSFLSAKLSPLQSLVSALRSSVNLT